jgi:hypothetical protein
MPKMSRISPSWLLLLVPLVGFTSTGMHQFSKTYGNIQNINGVHVAKTPAAMPLYPLPSSYVKSDVSKIVPLDPLPPSTEIPIHKSSSYVKSDVSKIMPLDPLPPSTEIPMHKSSSYVKSDVSKIVHVPAESRIEVHLKDKSIRRCQNPVFKGRISGWSLSMIDFDYKSNDHERAADVVVGTYDLSQIPMSGRYYVEILVLLCEGYGEDFRGVNLMGVCIENVKDANQRITEENGIASIDIDIGVDRSSLRQQQNSTSRGGRWLNKKFLSKQAQIIHQQQLKSTEPNSADAILPPKPLFTKYATKNYNYTFMDYTFRWNRGPDEVLNKPGLVGLLAQDDEGKITKTSQKSLKPQQRTQVCFLGASHSRELTKHCLSLLEETCKEAHQDSIPELNCTHVDLRYPEQVTGTEIFGKYGCTHVVVGLFQWPFSYIWKDESHWDFSNWETEMTEVVRILEQAVKGRKIPLRRVILRSAHPNGLKDEAVSCPMKDQRIPPTADAATTILREIAESFSPIVSFLDTNFIIDPVWDSAKDYSHYIDENGEVEAKFILSEILKEA